MIFLSADSHFDHTKILGYCNRDFVNVEAMNNTLIDAWNKTVSRNDTVYYLGDFVFGDLHRANELFSVLNGEIHVLSYPFHHDRFWLPKEIYEVPSWVSFEPPLMVLKEDNRFVTLCHFPLQIWPRKHYNQYHCHGHSHGKLDASRTERILDVGVDNAFRLTGEYRPFALYEALEIMDARAQENKL